MTATRLSFRPRGQQTRGRQQRPRRRRRRRQQFSYRKAMIVTCWTMVGVCSYGLLGWTWMSIDEQLQQQQQQQTSPSHNREHEQKILFLDQPSPPVINNKEDPGSSSSSSSAERHLRHVVKLDDKSEQQQQQQKLWYDRGRKVARTVVGAVQPILNSATSVFTTTTKKGPPPTASLPPPPPPNSSSADSSSKTQSNNYLRQKTRRYRSKSASQGIIWVFVFPICIILIVLFHRTQSYGSNDEPSIERLVCFELSRIASRLGFNVPSSSSTTRSQSTGRQRESSDYGDTSNQTPMLLQSLALLNEDRHQRGEEPITLDSLVAFQRVLSDRSLWVGLAERYRLYEQEQQQQEWVGMTGNLNTSRTDEEIEHQRQSQKLATKIALEERCPLWTLDTINGPRHDEECIICLSTFEKNDTLRTLPCQHSFHAGCIDIWMDRSSQCPMCKQSILS